MADTTLINVIAVCRLIGLCLAVLAGPVGLVRADDGTENQLAAFLAGAVMTKEGGQTQQALNSLNIFEVWIAISTSLFHTLRRVPSIPLRYLRQQRWFLIGAGSQHCSASVVFTVTSMSEMTSLICRLSPRRTLK